MYINYTAQAWSERPNNPSHLRQYVQNTVYFDKVKFMSSFENPRLHVWFSQHANGVLRQIV